MDTNNTLEQMMKFLESKRFNNVPDGYVIVNRSPTVGDIIVPADGANYVGVVTRASKEEDIVEHRCTKTGKTYTKSWFGSFCRYNVIDEKESI